MQTKLICSDIDGTLLNKDRELSEKSIEVIKDLSPIPFILISSRMPQAMQHLQQELDITHLPLICYNGGLIIDGDDVLHSTEINMDVIRALVDFCSGTQIHSSLYHGREWYVPGMDFWANRESFNTKVIPVTQAIEMTLDQWKKEGKGAHKIMCMGDPAELDRLVAFIENNYKEQIVGYRSKPTYLEISPKSITKKTSLETLLDLHYPDLGLHNVMAFGDNYNDVDMLSAVGVGVAVENAITEAKDVADHKTARNIDDGVALFLEGALSS
ncbi:Cof-type HAD-IIB family hydrolase [Lutimonas vermicola]|uniref:Cof-type HAD-IIB family hydrolase n=1 Tax=Lutimonas vermicola TaxID=414288 RepID=A0ABU9KZT3_9FLAO